MKSATIEDIWAKAIDSLAPLTDRVLLMGTEIMSLNRPTTVEPDELLFQIQGSDIAVYLATEKYKARLEEFMTKELGGIPCVLIR